MTSAASLRAKAAEVRRLAEASADPMIRWQLDDVASQFERLAELVKAPAAAERRSAPSRQPAV